MQPIALWPPVPVDREKNLVVCRFCFVSENWSWSKLNVRKIKCFDLAVKKCIIWVRTWVLISMIMHAIVLMCHSWKIAFIVFWDSNTPSHIPCCNVPRHLGVKHRQTKEMRSSSTLIFSPSSWFKNYKEKNDDWQIIALSCTCNDLFTTVVVS